MFSKALVDVLAELDGEYSLSIKEAIFLSKLRQFVLPYGVLHIRAFRSVFGRLVVNSYASIFISLG